MQVHSIDGQMNIRERAVKLSKIILSMGSTIQNHLCFECHLPRTFELRCYHAQPFPSDEQYSNHAALKFSPF
jgi:hypothetical protein